MVDLGWVIGNIFGALCLLVTFAYLIWASVTSDLEGERGLWLAGGIAALFIQIGINVWFNFPFSMEYHSYKPISGTVEDVNTRLLTEGSGDSRSVSQKYAIRLEGSDQIYGCQDTRCSLAKKGDKLKLYCERQWQYASVPGYDCRYGQ